MTIYEICYWQDNPHGRSLCSKGMMDSEERARAQLSPGEHIVTHDVSDDEYASMCEAGEIF